MSDKEELTQPLLSPPSRTSSPTPEVASPRSASPHKRLTTSKQHSLRQLTYIILIPLILTLYIANSTHLINLNLPFTTPRSSPSRYSTPSSVMSGSRVVPRPNGKVNVGYFVNWGIYARGFKPHEALPAVAPFLTHLLYAFANVGPSGTVTLSDAWADVEIHWPEAGDSWNDEGTNLFGCFKQLYKLKQANRHLKVLLSIGGWTYSPNFAGPMGTPEGRKEFVRSSVQLVEDLGLDGLDVDWEYPKNDKEAGEYVMLLTELRDALDALAASKGIAVEDGYELTIAAPCGPDNYSKLHIREMDNILSFWNLMAYDYAGSWDPVAGHQAALFGASPSALSTDRAIRHFTDQGVPTHHLVVGIPLYGRSFLATQGAGHPYNGVGKGSWEPGSYDYKVLPLPGAQEQTDPNLVAASCRTREGEWVTYDNPATAAHKADFINANNLGGAMYWELSGDKKEHEGGLVPLVARKMGRLDGRLNHLEFPGSKYDNLKRGMQ